MDNIQKKQLGTNVAAGGIMQGYRYIANTDLIEEMPAMMLSDDGVITDCNEACATLLGYSPAEVVWQHISKFLPQMHEAILFKDHHLNPQLRFLSRIGHLFKAVRGDGTVFLSKVFFVELGNTCESFIRVIIRPIEIEAMYS
jgi:PAS domain S-box-containing protein